jgi:hypothetical protein
LDENKDDGKVVEIKAQGDGTTLFNIMDPVKFKATMPLTERPQPVKGMREFEDTEGNETVDGEGDKGGE